MSAWSRALELADNTPPSRNRYVDFLRALSITAVIFGHWLIAAPWVREGELQLDHMLAAQPWTQWLTLLFQVMPVFFLVGGYSNSASWESARRSGTPYGTWVAGRARRLIGPVVPLVLTWAAMAFVFRRFGVSFEIIQHGSILALVPMWFLAVYLLVVLLVPVTHAAWQRFGIWSFWVPVAFAIAFDWLRFHDGHRPAIAWINYLFVWIAVHQLGYLWRDGRLAGARQALPWLAGGAIAWWLLTRFGPYPISMVGVPGEAISNTTPPDVLLLVFGMAQVGLVLALLIGLAMLLGDVGLHSEPGTTQWWLARVPWFATLIAGLGLLIPLVGRFERSPPLPPGFNPSTPRVLIGAALVSGGIAFLALDGIAAAGAVGVRGVVVGGLILGAWMIGAIGTRLGRPKPDGVSSP